VGEKPEKKESERPRKKESQAKQKNTLMNYFGSKGAAAPLS